MTDNTVLNPGSGGDNIRTIDRSVDSSPIPAKTQVVQIDIGGEANESLVSPSNPVPVDPNSSVPDGTVYNSTNVPQVGLIAGKGADNLVHPAAIDAKGQVQVTEQNLQAASSSDNPLFVVLTGDPSGDFSNVNIIEQVVTDGSGFAFNVKVLNPLKQDTQGATILSDAPAPISLNVPVGASVVIDTTGYQSINIGSQTLAGNITGTNDFKTFSAITGSPVTLGTLVTAISAGANFWFPCPTRYLIINPTTAGTAVLYLRNTPWNSGYVSASTANINEAQFGGNAVVTAGINGLAATGGNVAPGSARTAYPLPISGVDSSNLTRTLLTDISGRPQASDFGVDFTGTQRQIGLLPGALVPSMFVQDTTLLEGQTPIELLGQILVELKILNHQFFLLNSQGGGSASDEPSVLRMDAAFQFTQN